MIHSLADLDDSGGGGGGAGKRRKDVYSEGIYHEQQEGQMCAKHALNNTLQSKVFDEAGLGDIGRELDKWEKASSGKMHGDGGESNNLRDDGFFGIQVIVKALQTKRLTLTALGSEEARRVRTNVATQCEALIVNHGQHWWAIRRIGREWFDLNSMQVHVYTEE